MLPWSSPIPLRYVSVVHNTVLIGFYAVWKLGALGVFMINNLHVSKTGNFNKFFKGMEYNFNKYRQGEASTLGEPYDKKSVMHYAK